MTEFSSVEREQLLALLNDISRTGHETAAQVDSMRSSIGELAFFAWTWLSFRKDELRNQKLALFSGKSTPKQRLIELYLSIGSGKTRKELINTGFPQGTVWRCCAELLAESLLKVNEVRPDGEEVLGYTLVERLTGLSGYLKDLSRTG